MSSIVLHIPHASRLIPKELLPSFLPSQARLNNELLVLTDVWADELVGALPFRAQRIIFPVSRLVVDPERFPSDDQEPMALKGMGATYTRLSSGEPLRKLSAADRTVLMDAYYYPHHRVLTAATESAVRETGNCLIIDVHSFSSSPLQHEADQAVDRPEICVGFDAFHSPFPGDADIISTCKRLGFSGSVNRPFSGSIVPTKFWRRDDRVRSFMIEVRRDVYMNEQTAERLPDFSEKAKQVCALIRALAEVSDPLQNLVLG
jgi:N-formylglutamate amidohydrolase